MDELYHGKWKYIKREWKKGKWRYWYKDDAKKGKSSKKKVESKTKSLKSTTSKKKTKKSKTSVISRVKNLVTKGKNFAKKYFTNTVSKARKYKDKGKTFVDNFVKSKSSKKSVDGKTKAKSKTKVNSKEKKTKEKTSILSKFKKAVDKGKNFVKKAFKKTVKEADEFVDKGKDFVENVKNKVIPKADDNKDPLPMLNKKTKKYSQKEDQAAVNPNYDPFVHEYSTNCGRCSLAYDLRRRGYDVEAQPDYSDKGLTLFNLNSCYDVEWNTVNPFKTASDYINRFSDDISGDPESRSSKGMKKLMDKTAKELAAEGDGARGIICVQWVPFGGHALNWEVEDGVTYIVDAQINDRQKMSEWSEASDVWCYNYIRTDNLTPDEDILKYVKNRE